MTAKQATIHGRRPPTGRSMKILAVVFSIAAGTSVVLVAVDLIIGRPAAGDIYIAVLNSAVAAVCWWMASASRRA